jgi:putative ubiquitin-RnfH superfamily antitoxin RatB of RatAB toxin-antitoxin module
MSTDKGAHVEVEVVYARPEMQRVVTIRVVAGTSAREVVRLSKLSESFPEIEKSTCPIGVFGAPVDNSYVVQAGDRVEVYRPLERDPREARRELAARGLTMGMTNGMTMGKK